MLEALVQPLYRRPGMFTQQRHCGTAMARPRFMPALAPLGAVLRCQFGQFDQRVGHALHRRHHGDLHRLLACKQQLRHMPVALGIGHRGCRQICAQRCAQRAREQQRVRAKQQAMTSTDLVREAPSASGERGRPPHPDPGAGPLFSEITRRRRTAPGEWWRW